MDDAVHDQALYPAIEPFDAGWLNVGDGHRIHFEQCGRPDGYPVLFLHGGPGSGCSHLHRRLFNPEHCRILLFDQRGCGRSQPQGSVQANTSTHLVADIERLRTHFGIDHWLVVGGSWGAGLALAYAAALPAACSGLVLRSVFLGRVSDVDWFFRGARQCQPQAWETLLRQAPLEARKDPLRWLHVGLQQNVASALPYARAWQAWEATLSGEPTPPAPDAAGALALVHKYRLQSHYLVNGCFWGASPLLTRAATLGAVPAILVHGDDDAICLPQAARALHAALPLSRLRWVPGCGHTPYAPAMVHALGEAVRDLMGPER
ncbi:MAG: prolyl aminopeptidase [Burkholderiales bacterium]|nr:prolyl aminopeptidase [Burkholderiales bacterium]